MSRDAFVLRTAVFGGDPLAALMGNLRDGSTICDFGRRDGVAVRNTELKNHMDWRLRLLSEKYLEEKGLPHTRDMLKMHFRQMAWWEQCIAAMQQEN